MLRARYAMKPPPPQPNYSPMPIVQDQVRALKNRWASAQIAILDTGAIIHLHFSPAEVFFTYAGSHRWTGTYLAGNIGPDAGFFETHLDALVGRHIWRWDLEGEKYLESDR